MKRSKPRSFGAGREESSDDSFWSKPQAAEPTWDQAVAGQPDEAFSAYAMQSRFAKGQLVTHGKFGRGVVVDTDPLRVEILFQDGKKKLGHGQAP